MDAFGDLFVVEVDSLLHKIWFKILNRLEYTESSPLILQNNVF